MDSTTAELKSGPKSTNRWQLAISELTSSIIKCSRPRFTRKSTDASFTVNDMYIEISDGGKESIEVYKWMQKPRMAKFCLLNERSQALEEWIFHGLEILDADFGSLQDGQFSVEELPIIKLKVACSGAELAWVMLEEKSKAESAN